MVETLLVVEDDPSDRALMARALKKAGTGLDVVTVSDGFEALDYLLSRGAWGTRKHASPRAVLLDLNLPGKHGLDVLRELRATPATRRLPVVILSSSSEESDVRAGYELGANSYVRKPVNFDMFLEVARQICAYWTSVNLCVLSDPDQAPGVLSDPGCVLSDPGCVLSDPDQAPGVLSDPGCVLSDPDQAPGVLSDPGQAPAPGVLSGPDQDGSHK